MAKKTEVWKYTWSDWVATISKHPRRNEYRWSVEDANGNDCYNFYNHVDVELETPLMAETDMFYAIHDRIGHMPEIQINKDKLGW